MTKSAEKTLIMGRESCKYEIELFVGKITGKHISLIRQGNNLDNY